jgi:hypothetical protein
MERLGVGKVGGRQEGVKQVGRGRGREVHHCAQPHLTSTGFPLVTATSVIKSIACWYLRRERERESNGRVCLGHHLKRIQRQGLRTTSRNTETLTTMGACTQHQRGEGPPVGADDEENNLGACKSAAGR